MFLKSSILNLTLDHPSARASGVSLNYDPGVELWVLCVFNKPTSEEDSAGY